MNNANLLRNDERYLDFHYAAQITICLLRPIGAWPLDRQASPREIVVHYVSIVISTFLQLFMVVPWIIFIVTANLSFVDILRTICPLIYCTTIFLRYLLLLFHRDDVKSCTDRICEDWRDTALVEDREIMLTYAKSGRVFGIMSVVFVLGCGIPYCIMPLVVGSVITVGNITLRPLPNPSELLIFDVQASPVYEVTYALECFSAFVIYIVFSGICSLTAKLVAHVCGQCDILMALFDELIDGGIRNRGDIDQRINTVVTRHLRIIRFVSDIDKMLNEICLAEFVNASCNICLLCYYIITDWNNQEMLQVFVYVVGFISVISNIYIFCYLGELLVDRCQKISTACYMIEWYRLPYMKARSLILPIIMSNYPFALTAGKMLPMTMNSFSDILRTSMAYFNLLREISGRDIT